MWKRKPGGVRSGAHAGAGEPVVAGVDLDRVEVLGVVAEPVLRRQAARVPVLDQRLVGERAGADANGVHREPYAPALDVHLTL
jgi:hypothetical protein